MTSDKTTIALRVLSAINAHEKPSDADVLLLQLHCPGHESFGPDELACIVIQEMYERHKQERDRAGRKTMTAR